MLNGPNKVAIFGTSVFAIAGYYTDYDHLQHVVAAANNGDVYELHWDPMTLDPSEVAPGYPPVGRLWHFDSMVTIAGFFTPDDNYHHAVVGTRVAGNSDGTLHELYFRLGEAPNSRDPLYHINSFDPNKGMASFYSPCDDLRHVVIVDRNGHPVDITWNKQQAPKGSGIVIPLTDSQIASISGFLSKDENPNTRHIVVAQNDTGQIYDIAYPGENNVSQNYVLTSFNEPVQNVTAFFSSDTNYRHIVVLTRTNFLKDLAYPTYHVSGVYTGSIQLISPALANVADITSLCSLQRSTSGDGVPTPSKIRAASRTRGKNDEKRRCTMSPSSFSPMRTQGAAT